MNLHPRPLLALALAALACVPARAEKADKDKPTQIEASRMSADDTRRLSIFEGSVVLKKGSLTLQADRVTVRRDAAGFQQAVATGTPVRFRQKADAQDGRAGVWIEGEALRVEIDERNEKLELFDQARIARDGDEVHGDYILFDQRTEFFNVSGAKGGDSGRVRVVIQPKGGAEGAAKPPAAGETR